MNQTTLHDDLAYVRDLAEAGQSAPLLGGRFLTFWGVLTSVSYFLHYSISAGLFGWPDVAYAWVWGTFIIAGIIGQAVLGYSIRNKPGGNSVGNRTEATVWMAGGFALFAYFATADREVVCGRWPGFGVRAIPAHRVRHIRDRTDHIRYHVKYQSPDLCGLWRIPDDCHRPLV